MKKGLIKVSVLYPTGEGKTFDMDYYCNKHVPMVGRLLGAAVKSSAIEKGLAGGAPGAPATYVTMGHLYFETVEAFQHSFGPHADEIMSDIPKFTNSVPLIQISEVIA